MLQVLHFWNAFKAAISYTIEQRVWTVSLDDKMIEAYLESRYLKGYR